MTRAFLPREVVARAPPIKIQGIKTGLVPLIARSIAWNGDGTWIEPFLGSGAVALNIAPERALLADTNRHVIDFYRGIRDGRVTGSGVRRHLVREGSELLDRGESHYYFIRDRFNDTGDPLDFVFLSRACFNGMMRFNGKGGFNVPFCRKPDRFRPALVTRIVNQVEWAAAVMRDRDWHFEVQDWRRTVASAREGDMLYCDPPYVGRHADYYNGFADAEADELAAALIAGRAGFALSMWLENRHRRNPHVERWFADHPRRSARHYYHVGASRDLRGEMTEVVILSGSAASDPDDPGEGSRCPGARP